MSLQDFFNQYNGQGVDFDGYAGDQCVDLVQFYNRDVVAAPRLTGNAADIWDTYPQANYDRIDNAPDNFPQPGDIVIWNRNVGGGNGHIDVCQTADANSFTGLDQNWPTGSVSHFQQHDYANVLGWLHPKTAPIDTVAVPSDTFKQLVDKSTKYDAFAAAGYATMDDVLKKVGDLNSTITNLQQEIQQTKNDAQAAHQQAAQVSSEDSAAIQSGLDAAHERDQLKIQLSYIAHQLGLPDNAAYQQVEDAITALNTPAIETAKQTVPILDALYQNAATKPLTFRDWLAYGWNKFLLRGGASI